MRSQLKTGALLSYITLFITSATSILYTPVMLNLLGQSEYGLYSLAASTVGYIGVLNFGLGNAVIRYTAKYKALNDGEACSNLFGMFFIMYLTLGTAAFIVGLLLSRNLHLLYSNTLSDLELEKMEVLSTILTINIALGIALGLFSVIILAHEKFVFQKLIVIGNAIITPCVTLPFLFWGYGSIAIVLVTTILNVVMAIINIYFCFKCLKIKITFKKLEKGILKEILIFSLFIFLNLIIEKIYWSTDQIIIGIFSGTVAVSIYTIGASFSGYFSGFSAAISGVFLSKVSRMVTKNANDEDISELFIKIGRIQFIIISFALSAFIVFGQEFINLWVGEEYKGSFLIALLILIPMAIPLIQSMGGVILQAKNMQKFKSITYVVIAVANVLLSLILVQKWGAVGCAIATAIAFTAGNIVVMNIYYWRKVKINIPKFWINILFMSRPLVLAIILGSTSNILLNADNWLFFCSKALIFTTLYSFLLWKLAMNKYEKDLVAVAVLRILNLIGIEKKYKVS